LPPGESRVVTFTLGPDDLKLLDVDHNWVVEPGAFEVNVGGLQGRFEVTAPRLEAG
jgi:beta-glucosidase